MYFQILIIKVTTKYFHFKKEESIAEFSLSICPRQAKERAVETLTMSVTAMELVTALTLVTIMVTRTQ